MGENQRIWRLTSPDGQSHGPYTSAEMAQHIRTGRIQASTNIWREGWAEWQRAADVPDFGGLIPNARSPSRQAAGAGPAPSAGRAPGSDPRLQRLSELQQKMRQSIQSLSDKISRK